LKSVLIVDLGKAWGGQEVYSADIADALVASGHRVTLLSGHERHARTAAQYIPCSFAYADFAATRRQVQELAARHDLVHYNGIRAIYLSALTPVQAPAVGTKHLGFFSPGKARLQGGFARLATVATFRNLRELICVSQAIHQELPGTLRQRSVVVRNGVMRLLAAAQLLRARQVRVRFVLAGSGPLEQAAREYVRANALGDMVELCGHVADPASIYLRSHVCVLPSSYEGQPLSLMEALACSCALVTHEIPGVDEIVEEGVNGLYAAADEHSLAAVVERLARDRQLLERLMAGARASYDGKWRFERMFAGTLEIFRRAARR
jgi:glycosyltransferase involved in cell wall biosynthesis